MMEDDICEHCRTRIVPLRIGTHGGPEETIWVDIGGGRYCDGDSGQEHEPE